MESFILKMIKKTPLTHSWCRGELGISDTIMFETEDLVLRKNEKNFILTLLEVRTTKVIAPFEWPIFWNLYDWPIFPEPRPNITYDSNSQFKYFLSK